MLFYESVLPWLARLSVVALLPTLAGCFLEDSGPTFGDFDTVAIGRPQIVGPTGNGVGDRSHPIVLAHGFLSCAELGFDNAIVRALQAEGFTVARTCVDAVQPIAVRARSMAPQINQILEAAGARKVHIIGHSMGGLDARYLIGSLGYAALVRSVTTISTPHEGSPLADLFGTVTAASREDGLVKNALAKALGVGHQDTNFAATLRDLSTRHAGARNRTLAKTTTQGVYFQSFAGISTAAGAPHVRQAATCAPSPGATALVTGKRAILPLAFSAAAPIVAGFTIKPHDGVVAVANAKFGTFRGCIPASHTRETEATTSFLTGYDSVAFYRQVASELAGVL